MDATSIFTGMKKRFNGVISPSFLTDIERVYEFSGNCFYTDLIIPTDRVELLSLTDEDVTFLDENDSFTFKVIALK